MKRKLKNHNCSLSLRSGFDEKETPRFAVYRHDADRITFSMENGDTLEKSAAEGRRELVISDELIERLTEIALDIGVDYQYSLIMEFAIGQDGTIYLLRRMPLNNEAQIWPASIRGGDS